jgi:hypothetical protein
MGHCIDRLHEARELLWDALPREEDDTAGQPQARNVGPNENPLPPTKTTLAVINPAIHADISPDGPFDGDSFAWQGKVCDGLTNLEYHLLSYFWDEGRLIACANYDELKEHVWGGKEVQWSTVKSQVSRTNTKLNEEGIYLGLETDAEYYVRVSEFKNRRSCK